MTSTTTNITAIVTATYAVSGMTCGCCAKRVTGELTGLPGAPEVTVDLAGGQVTLASAAALAEDQVSAAVERAGYRLLHTVGALT